MNKDALNINKMKHYIMNFIYLRYLRRFSIIIFSVLLIVISQFSSALQINPHYGVGFSASNRKVLMVRQIVDHVLNSIIEPQLGGQIPLELNVELISMPGNTTGGGIVTRWTDNRGGYIPGQIPDTWCACALASQRANQDYRATSGEYTGYHMCVRFNLTMIDNGDMWLEYDKPCPTNKADLLSTVIHEIGHSLCFKDVVNADGSFPSNMPSTLEMNMSWEIDGDHYEFVPLSQAGRETALLGGDICWNGSHVHAVGQQRRLQFPNDPGFCFAIYAKMNAPIGTGDICHWNPSHNNPEQVMEPVLTTMAREIGLLGPALQDMGWPDMTLFVAVPTTLHFAPSPMNKGMSDPQTIVVSSNWNGTTSILFVEILGEHAGSFSILSGGSPGTLPFLATRYINIGFNPGSIGFKTATLRISYNDGTAKYIDVALEGFGIMIDNDGDGISDFDETRDLYGVSNPFNWQVTDSTGENGETTGDGVDDGYNDFDGDGMNNREEFIFGYNPIDPNNFGVRTDCDVDGDGILDEDERADLSGPFDPYNGDTSGDNFSDFPDGIPDGQNDYDGDGFDNAFEYRWGTNPLEPDYDIKIPAFSSLSLVMAVLSLLLFGILFLKKYRRECSTFTSTPTRSSR